MDANVALGGTRQVRVKRLIRGALLNSQAGKRPAENLVGSCGNLGSARTSKGIVPRKMRRYFYLHPDQTDARLIENFRSSCATSEGDWQDPPSADKG
jgi:hypothetical protein